MTMTVEMSQVAERPILFTGPMVRAILDGSKTQTRRAIKRLPEGHVPGPCHWSGMGWAPWTTTVDGDLDGCKCSPLRCPYGQPGDLLYVRETWRVTKSYDSLTPKETVDFVGKDCEGFVQYMADGEKPDLMGYWGKTRRSIFMPKAFARLWLRVTDVRAERVQEISREDAIAEGIECYTTESGNCICRGVFRDLWDSINESRGFGWSSNPWVWVVAFEMAEAP